MNTVQHTRIRTHTVVHTHTVAHCHACTNTVTSTHAHTLSHTCPPPLCPPNCPPTWTKDQTAWIPPPPHWQGRWARVSVREGGWCGLEGPACLGEVGGTMGCWGWRGGCPPAVLPLWVSGAGWRGRAWAHAAGVGGGSHLSWVTASCPLAWHAARVGCGVGADGRQHDSS